MQLVDKICADNDENAAGPAAAVEKKLDKSGSQQCQVMLCKGNKLRYVVFIKSVLVDHVVKTSLLLTKMLLMYDYHFHFYRLFTLRKNIRQCVQCI